MKLKGERDSGRGNRNPTLKSARATPKLENFGITRDQAIEIDESDELFPKGEFEAALELLPKLVPSWCQTGVALAAHHRLLSGSSLSNPPDGSQCYGFALTLNQRVRSSSLRAHHRTDETKR